MRSALALLCLLLACLPVGVLATDPAWTYTAPTEITYLSLTPDGSYVLAGGGRLCLLDGNGTPLWEEWSADQTACSGDAELIAGAIGPSLTLYSKNATILWRKDLSSDCVGLAFSRDGKRLVVADLLGEVHFYNADGTLRTTVDTRGDPDDDDDDTGVLSLIHDIALSDDGAYLAVISSRGLFYYTGTGKKLWAHEDKLESGTIVAVSGKGEEIAAASESGVRLLNRTGGLLWTHATDRPVTALAISQNGSRVIVGSQDNTLTCFDRDGETLWTFTAGGWIRDIAVSQNSSRILAGSMDKKAYLFDGEGNLLDTYALDGWVDHVALTADGSAGVAASSDEVIGFSTALPVQETAAQTASVTETPTNPTVQETPTTQGTERPTKQTVPETPTAQVTGTTSAPDSGKTSIAPLLLAGFLVGGAVLGAGYAYRRRRRPTLPDTGKETRIEAPPPAPVEEEETRTEVPPWEACLEAGCPREAASLLSRQMTTLIEERTGTRMIRTTDALDACPDQREALAAFFAAADRLAYAPPIPEREEVEALAAAYLRLADRIR